MSWGAVYLDIHRRRPGFPREDSISSDDESWEEWEESDEESEEEEQDGSVSCRDRSGDLSMEECPGKLDRLVGGNAASLAERNSPAMDGWDDAAPGASTAPFQ
ncbi:hypothetical protein FOZ62_003960 [Perkinsus olseni]|uniref:Uncharacterized protein n=1 Tax=Perkinsus olseni TaxID=32597 RepID=A0A7J6RM33_PEROL|nr:hypothetical protein FOZ62_003960 [Perkinsus olseni]